MALACQLPQCRCERVQWPRTYSIPWPEAYDKERLQVYGAFGFWIARRSGSFRVLGRAFATGMS